MDLSNQTIFGLYFKRTVDGDRTRWGGHEPGVSLSTVAKQMWSGINNTATALTHGT